MKKENKKSGVITLPSLYLAEKENTSHYIIEQSVLSLFEIVKNFRREEDQMLIRDGRYERRSISVSAPRQSGNTHALIELIRNNPQETWMIIGYNRHATINLMHRIEARLGSPYEVYSIETIMHNSFRINPLSYSAVVVDCASYLSEEKINRIYEIFGGNPRILFAFIG